MHAHHIDGRRFQIRTMTFALILWTVKYPQTYANIHRFHCSSNQDKGYCSYLYADEPNHKNANQQKAHRGVNAPNRINKHNVKSCCLDKSITLHFPALRLLRQQVSHILPQHFQWIFFCNIPIQWYQLPIQLIQYPLCNWSVTNIMFVGWDLFQTETWCALRRSSKLSFSHSGS